MNNTKLAINQYNHHQQKILYYAKIFYEANVLLFYINSLNWFECRDIIQYIVTLLVQLMIEDGHGPFRTILSCGSHHSLLISDDDDILYGCGAFKYIKRHVFVNIGFSKINTSNEIQNNNDSDYSKKNGIQSCLVDGDFSAVLTKKGEIYGRNKGLTISDDRKRVEFTSIGQLENGEHFTSFSSNGKSLYVSTSTGELYRFDHDAFRLKENIIDDNSNICLKLVRIRNNPKVLFVKCGFNYVIVMTKKGLYGSGENIYGQLGNMNGKSYCSNFKRIHIYHDIHVEDCDIISVSCGVRHTMILTKTALYACGYNEFGALGLGKHMRTSITEPTKVNFPVPFKDTKIISVSCGNENTMVLTTDGLFSTGVNESGKLGIGNTENIFIFTKVLMMMDLMTPIPIKSILSFSCGDYHTTIITKNGIYSCGSNQSGQLCIQEDKNCNSIKTIPTKQDIIRNDNYPMINYFGSHSYYTSDLLSIQKLL